jgi:hypothetical protein
VNKTKVTSGKNYCNIFMVYITEAHASDVWNIGMSAGAINPMHQTIDQRIKCAESFKQEFDFQIPVYCDNMANDFETIFSAWPTRYFVCKNNHIIAISEPRASEIDINQLLMHIPLR